MKVVDFDHFALNQPGDASSRQTPTYSIIPAMAVSRSLKSLLLTYQCAFLLLVVVTGGLGGMLAYFWQQSSEKSVRLNALMYGAQQVRGDLYAQLKRVTRARLMEEPAALNQYARNLPRINEQFRRLRENSRRADVRLAIETMERTYQTMQKEMSKVFTEPYVVSEAARMSILDPKYEARVLGDFDRAFDALVDLVGSEHRALEERLERWTRLAPVVIPGPILLAAGLLLLSHRSLQRSFVRPMGAVLEGARKISEGRLDYSIPQQGAEEISDLAGSINDMARDLSASQRALVASERQAALGALVPVVAHNIRNPLASIRATAQILEEPDGGEQLRSAKQAITDTVDRLERWVSSLLSYLTPLQPHRTRVRLAALVEGATAPLKPKLEEKAIDLDWGKWDSDDALYVDVDLLEQVIYGLLLNAVEASPKGATLKVSMQRAAESLALIIDDQGAGMPFNPEPSELSPGPSTKRYGTGLGIPFAFKVCTAHGGTLSYEPAAGGGTRTRLSLPAEVKESAAT
jgi:signal transduction histidine kinase